MTTIQMRWARDHHWFVSARKLAPNTWEILAKDDYVLDGVLYEGLRYFMNFRALRAHAGY